MDGIRDERQSGRTLEKEHKISGQQGIDPPVFLKSKFNPVTNP